MELVAGIGELLFLLNMAWIAISLPLWLVLAAVTYVGHRRSRGGRGSGWSAAARTRLGRPAMVTALVLVALIALSSVTFSIALGQEEGALLEPLLWVIIGCVLCADALSMALTVVFVAIVRDVFTERCVAGWDTAVAYVMVSATGAVLVGAALLSGLSRGIV